MIKMNTAKSFEINFVDRGWMIQLGKMSRYANRIVLKNFEHSVASRSFVMSISAETRLEVTSWDGDLVMERAL